MKYDPLTIYLPVEVDSGPYCSPGCIGNWSRRTVCAVFWQDLVKARDHKGKPMRRASGFVYKKCGECLREMQRSNTPPPSAKTITVKWRPPPDIVRSG